LNIFSAFKQVSFSFSLFSLSNIYSGVQQLQNVLDKSVEHLDTTSQTLRSNPVLFETNRLIEKLLSDCCTTHALGNRELLDPVIEVNVPPCLIGDSAKIAQILGYFLENSVKFTDDSGKIGVYVTLNKEQPKKGEKRGNAGNGRRGSGSGGDVVVVDFSVVDNGVGMNSDTRALLFKPLVQGDRYDFIITNKKKESKAKEKQQKEKEKKRKRKKMITTLVTSLCCIFLIFFIPP
jgi:signal transduction histidine kinase